ncbi:hypothetical protein KL909_000622 [Ogataea angusta]|nr:hypothetical protein KL909_000622 [Ogataea angusta]
MLDRAMSVLTKEVPNPTDNSWCRKNQINIFHTRLAQPQICTRYDALVPSIWQPRSRVRPIVQAFAITQQPRRISS